MSHVLSISQMIDLEKQAFADGVDAWELMLEAGGQMVEAIADRCPTPGVCRVYPGKGNNGGDAWVVARGLHARGWQVEIGSAFPDEEMAPLASRAKNAWTGSLDIPERRSAPTHVWRKPWIVVDGLLGIGSRGEPRAPIEGWIREINALRGEGAVVFALDLPSGLGCEVCVVADHTLTVGFAKAEMLEDAATHFAGRISVLPLVDLSRRHPVGTGREVASAVHLRQFLPPRSFDIHKGQCGRVLLVAGSRGTAGAAVLAAQGALRAGAGLVSLVCPLEIYPTLAPMLPPEVMARPWGNLEEIASAKVDVLAIGPGLDPIWEEEIWSLLVATRLPVVLDAGGLTILARNLARFRELRMPLLLTPHPGEMERLYPACGRPRAQWAMDFLAQVDHPRLTLLLKGSRTLVAGGGEPLGYNPTGHPGMATGGMGDTLTGVCAALIGQKLTLPLAARIGAWVCGRAGEIAIARGGQSQESLLPTDLAAHLGLAFGDLRAGAF